MKKTMLAILVLVLSLAITGCGDDPATDDTTTDDDDDTDGDTDDDDDNDTADDDDDNGCRVITSDEYFSGECGPNGGQHTYHREYNYDQRGNVTLIQMTCEEEDERCWEYREKEYWVGDDWTEYAIEYTYDENNSQIFVKYILSDNGYELCFSKEYSNGEMTSLCDANCETHEPVIDDDHCQWYEYNSSGNLSKEYGHYEDITYEYNDDNLLTKQTNEWAGIWLYEYNELGQVVFRKSMMDDGETVAECFAYEYNHDGYLVEMKRIPHDCSNTNDPYVVIYDYFYDDRGNNIRTEERSASETQLHSCTASTFDCP